jgi:hypothetical protein
MNRYFNASLALVLGGVGLGATAGAALAGPREDVLYGAQRCASIVDNRTWLDCFYGSAQPMRAQLGLPPAPAGQVGLVPPPPPPGSYAPPTAQDPFAAPRNYGVGALSAPAPSGPPPIHKPSAGFFGDTFNLGQAVTSNLRMTSYSFDKAGRFTVTLSDGEVWQQITDDDSAYAHWKAPANTYVVSVYIGAAGTFNLENRSDTNTYKVKRLK